MHPLVAFAEELERLRELTARTVDEEGGIDVRVRHDDRAASRLRARRRDRRARRLLLVRNERSHADCARILARRRRGHVPLALSRGAHSRARPVPDARPVGRRRSHAHRGRARPRRTRPDSGSGSAASTAAIPRRSRSATGSGSTTSPARPTASRSRGSWPRRPCSPRQASAPTPRPAGRSRHSAGRVRTASWRSEGAITRCARAGTRARRPLPQQPR